MNPKCHEPNLLGDLEKAAALESSAEQVVASGRYACTANICFGHPLALRRPVCEIGHAPKNTTWLKFNKPILLRTVFPGQAHVTGTRKCCCCEVCQEIERGRASYFARRWRFTKQWA